ncbi:helicase-like transcription factor [Fusarium beomiforme]|uniref:Helicase-like transcription factor n=1 Tax=Fusarium beomiforme TaxID=44412 RepID=A0A9P5E3J5_9HYPO|nr:helicase-like transcription factor [Fusarium beomiforme]
MFNFRDLSNPVHDDRHADYLALEKEPDNYMRDIHMDAEPSLDGSVNVDSLAPWPDFYGQAAEANDYPRPDFANPLVQNDVLDIDSRLEMIPSAVDFDIDIRQTTPLPEGEQSPSRTSTALEIFRYLELPTESSGEGSSRTPGISGSSQSNATPMTLPGDDDGMVHYGMLHNIEVKLVPDDMASIDERLAAEGSAYQHFIPTEYQNQLMLCFPNDGKHFGHLPSAAGKTLIPLITRPGVDIEPLALKFDLREVIHRANKSADARVKVNINIYGLRSEASYIGRILSDGKMWLQRSIHGRRHMAYENPHFLSISIQDSDPGEAQNTQLVLNESVQKKKTKEDQLRMMVEEIYKTVENNHELEMIEGGERVTRQLLRHQKEALGFMLERESGHINQKYRLWEELEHEDGRVQYRHRITKRRRDLRPEEKGGGILADDMGMGKSLSILALVMKTLDNGQEWAKEKNEEYKSRKSLNFSRSTLVVVSAALLVDEWMNEVKKHLQRGLKVVKYHGEKRPKSLEELSIIENSDIVVTTYHTLTSEYLIENGKTSPLYKLGWYRIVLDEAHVIRRPSTKFFQACENLHANSRWCLSGTPIQNKLADIGSLFRFIRANPFDKASEFRKWIETPFDNSFDSPELLVRLLDFSPEEKSQYDKTKAIILRNMEHRMGEVEKSSQFGMFQLWLQLRIVCNHGTYQKLFSWHRRSLIEEREAIVGATGQYGEISCVGCEQPMPVLGCDWTKRMFEDECSHILCSKCIEESNMSLPGAQRRCPICVRWYKQSPMSGDEEVSSDASRPRKRRKGAGARDNHQSYFNEEGHSTKIRALVQDVQKDLWTTKSIIFSCWTRTLYLISRHLEKAKIPYLQLDGNSPLPQRQATLFKFENEDEMPVLIMTTGTGAFGLNLTCANRIFITELQWNPSVESQAISRAIRLGQDSEVRVTRYIIKGTVEEEIRQQQEYKKQIAALGFEEEIN